MIKLKNARGPSPRRRGRLNPGPGRIAAALSTIALLGAVPSAAHAVGWTAGPRFAVPPAGVPNDFVETPNGASTVAWFTQSAFDLGVPKVQLQHAAPDGTVSAPLDLGTGGPPSLATSTSNMTAVAWLGVSTTSDDATVHVALLDTGGE